ncbi:T6SS immunity protein Tli4 family protein, partial [Paludibacterium purpuratum]
MNPRIVYLLGLTLAWLAPTLYAAEPVMFDKTKTYCFGRYLVDIPVEAELKGQGNNYYAASIKSGKGMPDFTARMNAALTKRKNEPGKHGFKYVKSVYPEGGDRQIVVGKADLWGSTAYSIDAFVRMSLQKTGAGQFFYLSEEGLPANDIDAIVDNYRQILAAIRYRGEREIPSEPGFCIANGVIANDGKTPQAENASLAFQLKKNPDVWIRIESNVLFRSQPSL